MFYQNITIGKHFQLPELHVQYADFAYWQIDDKRGKALQSSMCYWKKQLGGELPVLELPTDQPRAARQTFTGGTFRFELSTNLTAALEKCSRKT
jgi:hypothetical protein